MSNPFFEQPILNSPYEYPTRHWELDDQGQPTQRTIESRRGAKFVTPIPKPKKRKSKQRGLAFGVQQARRIPVLKARMNADLHMAED